VFAREGARIIGCDVQDGAAEKTADALRPTAHCSADQTALIKGR
jgi:hypothetical protein